MKIVSRAGKLQLTEIQYGQIGDEKIARVSGNFSKSEYQDNPQVSNHGDYAQNDTCNCEEARIRRSVTWLREGRPN